MAKPLEKPAPSTPLSSFLKTAGEYKEFITLVVFVMGGILWAFAYFATKQQLKAVQCVLDANVAFLQGRMDSASLSQLMVENIKERAALEKPNLSQDEIVKRTQLTTTAPDIARRIADADNATAKALERLKAGGCNPY
jgi:hypothetical protein